MTQRGLQLDIPVAAPPNATIPYVVAKTGNDTTGTGRLAAPWLTVQKAVTTVPSGSTILVRAGTYAETVTMARSFVTIRKYPGDASPVISNGANPAIVDTAGLVGITLDGLTMTSTGDTANGGYALGLDHFPAGGASYWLVQNCTINGGVYVIGDHNTFANNTLNGGGTVANGFREYSNASHHNLYRENTVNNVGTRSFWADHETYSSTWLRNTCATSGSSGIDLDGYGQLEYLHTVSGNIISGCAESGIQLENAWACVIENNIITSSAIGIEMTSYGEVNDSGHSPHITLVNRDGVNYGDASDGEGKTTNTILRQNVTSGCAIGIRLNQAGGVSIKGNTLETGSDTALFLQSNCLNTVVQNNILQGTGARLVAIGGFSGVLVTDDHNLFSANPAYDDGTLTYTLASYQSGNPGKGTSSVVGAPNLTAHIPNVGSPAIGAGVDIGTTSDFAGNPRPGAAGYDIGAYETS